MLKKYNLCPFLLVQFGKKDADHEILTETNRFTSSGKPANKFEVQDAEGGGDDKAHMSRSIIPTPWRFVGETVTAVRILRMP